MESLFRYIYFLFLPVLLSGCWAASIPHEVPKSLGDPDMLEPLVGQHYEKVIEVLGLPNQYVSHADNRYMIYHTRGDGTEILFLVWVPIPVLDLGDKRDNSNLHCLRFEIDTDDRISKYKIKSSFRVPMFAGFNINRRCLQYFWTENEIRKFQLLSLPKATQVAENYGNAEAQLALYKSLVVSYPKLALSWLCKSADQFNYEATYRVGRYFEWGNDNWDKWSENVRVETDFIQAYVWYSRSRWYGSKKLQSFVKRHFSPEQHARARKALSEWEPGQCENKLKLIEDTQKEGTKPQTKTVFEPDWNELLQKAEDGNADIQLARFKKLSRRKPQESLVWLCRSADSGNHEARFILSKIYEYGGYAGIEKNVVKQDYKLAYVWLALEGHYDQEELQIFADRYLTSKQQIDAKKMLEDWKPGNCERELGLTQNN